MHKHESKFQISETIWINPLKTQGRIKMVCFVCGNGDAPVYSVRHADFSRMVETMFLEDEIQNISEHKDSSC